MASSSCYPSAPAFSSRSWKYDVFLSFRGEDTRKNFVDHLYSALQQQGIYTYKDDETLPRGELIGPSLLKAIEESQIAVIIFSENYANSSWCLDELAYIMKCKDTRSQIVMPIFYGVEPSEVRKQKRKYGETFAQHELGNNTRVESWRKALVDASNISGWEPQHIANGHESKGIDQIVTEISNRLQLVSSSVNENVVGIAARMQRLKLELQIGSSGVRMVGIWGVGGGGKTTLASSIYDEICSTFDGCCFLKNIREESSKNGLEKLQKKLLKGVLRKKMFQVQRVEEGRRMIMSRLCHRKALIVLDDVDHLDQLKALAGLHDWFGEGSRIIITTRDAHLLSAHRVDVIHKISLLNDNEAVELFCKHAPRDCRPIEDYELLVKEVVSYAGGLPLALEILGSFLCDKNIDEWMSALARLKQIPDSDIVQKLKISFDGLKSVEKDLFLDIACFYRRESKDTAMEKLDACGFHPVIGVKVLIQKALITISEDGEFDMHDLVQEMAHFIVRGEHPNNPEKHSRVWKKEDVLKICVMDATTKLDKIQAIQLWDATDDESQLFFHAVANMKKLRVIDLYIMMGIKTTCPLPENFPPRELCNLDLGGMMQKQIWEGYKYLQNLRYVKLCRLHSLIMTPDFDGLPNLERFTIFCCDCLEEIHPSIGRLEKLVLLYVEDCERLKMVPPLTILKKLESLAMSFCPELFNLSKIQQKMDNMPHLDLDNNGKEVASSIGLSPNFFVFCSRCGCSNLPGVECCLKEPSLPHNNMNHHIGLQFSIRGLRKLDLIYNKLGDEEMGSAVWDLPNLQELDLDENNFSRLNFSRLCVPRLKWLNVSHCKKLVELSGLPSSIAVIRANYCISLESFGDISNCKWLWKVVFRNRENKFGGEILLNSMLQGNAVEDHFISVLLSGKCVSQNQIIPKGFLVRGKTFKLHLPDGWYNEFCGFLICIVTDVRSPQVTIIIKEEVDEDAQFETWQEFDEAVEPDYDETTTSIGYVSFNSLRHTALSTSSYNMISFSLEGLYGSPAVESYVGARLIPRVTKDDQVQTRDGSEYWYGGHEGRKTFSIQHDSQPSIKVLWAPYN